MYYTNPHHRTIQLISSIYHVLNNNMFDCKTYLLDTYSLKYNPPILLYENPLIFFTPIYLEVIITRKTSFHLSTDYRTIHEMQAISQQQVLKMGRWQTQYHVQQILVSCYQYFVPFKMSLEDLATTIFDNHSMA